MWHQPRVLFLCTGHPERSEMAEGFVRALAGNAIQPVSAAVEPAPLDPLAVDAIRKSESTFRTKRQRAWSRHYGSISRMW